MEVLLGLSSGYNPGADDPGVGRPLLERELWSDLSKPEKARKRWICDLQDGSAKGQAGPAIIPSRIKDAND
jgi:hypothetical protein